MKLEKDVVREILLQVEASSDPLGWVELDIPGHSYEVVAYHVEKLNEAGFLNAQELTSSSGYDWRAQQLTYEGHEFLDTVRDTEAWRFTKETAKKAGVSSIAALFEIAKSYAKQKLIEHGVHLQ
jgi:hypothetical protein